MMGAFVRMGVGQSANDFIARAETHTTMDTPFMLCVAAGMYAA